MKHKSSQFREGLAKFQETVRNIGDSPSQIARKLELMGIKGIIGDSEYCPIACYLHSHNYCNARVTQIRADDGMFYSMLPPAVMDFITYFDLGHYPNLECSAVTWTKSNGHRNYR